MAPASNVVAARLGWTPTKFNRKLDNVCDKLTKLGVRGLHGDAARLATSRKARLVEYALATQLVTAADLALLPDASARPDLVAGPGARGMGSSPPSPRGVASLGSCAGSRGGLTAPRRWRAASTKQGRRASTAARSAVTSPGGWGGTAVPGRRTSGASCRPTGTARTRAAVPAAPTASRDAAVVRGSLA